MKKEFLMAVSNELKFVRIEHDDRQEDLAEKSGVAPSTISKYESGSNDISLIKLEEILKPYGINLYIFFNRILAKTQINSIPNDS